MMRDHTTTTTQPMKLTMRLYLILLAVSSRKPGADVVVGTTILPQPVVPPATRTVEYGPLLLLHHHRGRRRGARTLEQPRTLPPGWHHVHIDARIEDPDQVFATIRAGTAPQTAPLFVPAQKRRRRSTTTPSNAGGSSPTIGKLVSSLKRRSLLQQNPSEVTNIAAFVGQEIELNITNSSNNWYNTINDLDDVNSTVTSDGTVSSDTEYNITETRYNNDTTTIVSTNNTAKAMEYRPLRLKAFVSDQAGNAHYLNQTEHSLLLTQILRPALLAWSAALRVPPVTHPLTVDPTQLVDGLYCGPGPSVQVPPSHMAEGVDNVDMILYVHMSFQDRNASETCRGDYVAASSFCSTDQFDRPVAALLHLCITEGFFDNIQSNIQSVMHEIGHALGFNAFSLAHFRKPDGSPWTKRDSNGAVPLRKVNCTGPYNVTATIPLPSLEILQFQTVRGGVRVAQVVTPSVRQVVRNHFDCQQLPGAELESGEYLPTSVSSSSSSNITTTTTSCIGDHWERRLFQTDLMNPIIDEKVSFNPYFSTLTLAYFADSGWYQVDLSRASMASNWGRAAGCDFVEKDCIRDGQVPSKYEAFFCAQEDDDETLRGCTIDLERKAFCSMGTFDGELPLAYQYFNGSSNLGGNDPFMDYCPVYSGFANGLCTDISNEATLRASGIERFGKRNSRCVAGQVALTKPPSVLVTSESQGSGFASNSNLLSFQTEQRAFCMPIACVVEDRTLRIQVDGVWEICPAKDKVIIPRASSDVMSIVCPDPVRVCPTFYCSRDCLGTNKICNYTVGKCMCEAGHTSVTEEGPCVNVTATEPLVEPEFGENNNRTSSSADVPPTVNVTTKAPFYRPESTRDSSLPSPEDPLSDIYVQTARNLRNDNPSFWNARNTSIIAVAVFVATVFISALFSKRFVVSFPCQTSHHHHDDDNISPEYPGVAPPDSDRPTPDKLKLIASIVVDLRRNNTADLQRRMNMLQQRDAETEIGSIDVSSETSFVSYAGTIADLSEHMEIPRNHHHHTTTDDFSLALSLPTTIPRPVRRRGLFSRM